MRPLLGVLATLVLGLVVGFVVGVAAVAVHPWWWGLLLGVGASLATLVALTRGPMRIAYAAAWAIVVALAASPRPTGGYAVAGNLEGYAVIVVAVLMLVVAAVTSAKRPAPADPGRRGA
ncbi:hypothetical protein FB381_3652 [Nocardioides albertanoniae]|uniref:Uncharacterized protein n=1 Tax=Nocardioides albertanoniae TaxID=1175486 RepID=A0A543AAW2_9ACTN|nr:hypothetical protein [Nocardioides albertanoniae]TQL69738.1 hypothetical protein FB381_3652 [Nocardioides albertanoniae]